MDFTFERFKFFRSYLFTKTFRFLLLQAVVSQNTSRKNFCFIPDFEQYDREFTDKYLWKLWSIDTEESKYISERITEINPELDV
jgi:site-specific DNA-methyltransferase (adenine-specific)